MTTTQRPKPKNPNRLIPWLNIAAITAWGVLILKYQFTGKLNLLIHRDYSWLAITGAIGLIFLGGLKAQDLLQRRRRRDEVQVEAHLTLLPPSVGSGLLLATAILGLIITPQVFASQTALQRGVTDSIGATRSQPQAFHSVAIPEKRSLVDWVRTLNVYPEPDAYAGQKAKVKGFVIHPPEMSNQYLLLSQFIITCCAADAYPVGLPVKLSDGASYSADSWLEVEGKMYTENLAGKRQLTIDSTAVRKIPQPDNPYSY